jgi:protein O-GlcNAc transferase
VNQMLLALALAAAVVAAVAAAETSPFCSTLFDLFDRANGPLADRDELSARIHMLDGMLSGDDDRIDGKVNECWFSYKVLSNYAHMLQLDGQVRLAIAQNRRAVDLAMKYNPKDVLTPAFNLATMLQTWSFGDPALVDETDRTWQLLQPLHDRSLRIRAATHLPNMLPSAPVLQAALGRLRSNLHALTSDTTTLDCEHFQKCGPHDPPQNISDWYPTYPLHYHLMDAADTMRIAAAVSRLYWRAAKGISWVAPPRFLWARQRQRHLSQGRGVRTKIRVGFLSRFFYYSHSLGQHIRGVMQHLDRSRFLVMAIHIQSEGELQSEDDMIGLADQDVYISPVVGNLHASRMRVASLRLDVLVFPDIGMEAVSYFMAFARLAPVQVSSWCFPASLGTGQIDYFLSADGLEPDGDSDDDDATAARDHYWEQIVQFRGGAPPWYFFKEDALRVPRSSSAARNLTTRFPLTRMHGGKDTTDETGMTTHLLHADRRDQDPKNAQFHYYLVPQNPIKLHSAMDPVLRAILEADPLAILIILSEPNFEETLQTRFRGSFEAHSARVLFVPRTKDRFSFRELLASVDVILDPWPWGGWTTTLQALCAKTPVVTLAARDARSRFTLNAYLSLGISELVARNTSDYVRIAVDLASAGAVAKRALDEKLGRAEALLLETPGTMLRWHAFLVRAVRLADGEFGDT